MILKPEERDFKTRVWNNLNKEWLEDQQERKRKKKEMKKKQKTYEIITNSSQISQSAHANSAGAITPDSQSQGFVLNSFLLEKKLMENAEGQEQAAFAVPVTRKSPIQIP